MHPNELPHMPHLGAATVRQSAAENCRTTTPYRGWGWCGTADSTAVQVRQTLARKGIGMVESNEALAPLNGAAFASAVQVLVEVLRRESASGLITRTALIALDRVQHSGPDAGRFCGTGSAIVAPIRLPHSRGATLRI